MLQLPLHAVLYKWSLSEPFPGAIAMLKYPSNGKLVGRYIVASTVITTLPH